MNLTKRPFDMAKNYMTHSLIDDLTDAINLQQDRKDRDYRELMQKKLQRIKKPLSLTRELIFTTDFLRQKN